MSERDNRVVPKMNVDIAWTAKATQRTLNSVLNLFVTITY